MHDNHDYDVDTIGIHADSPQNETSSLSQPIYQTTTFSADSAETFREMASTSQHPRFYARYGNPNHAGAEQIVGQLEKAERALMVASGMGAISTLVFALVESGDHVIAQKVHYAGTIGLLETLMPKFGVSTTFVDQTDVAAFEAAIQPKTKLIIVESPTNPLMTITDLPAIAKMARARGIITAADNTFATPINQRPLEMGIDVVYHSATKYLGGHHDVLAGVLAGSDDIIEKMWRTSITLGVTLNGFDSWLLVRGLRTLRLRVDQHNRNALAVAEMLQQHPKVKAVYYPGLSDHPQHALATAQMSGFTGMLSFELNGDYAMTDQFISRLQLIDRAASLGGVHSLIVHPAAMLASILSEEQFIERGVLPSLVRLSVGLESADDLIRDLMRALNSV